MATNRTLSESPRHGAPRPPPTSDQIPLALSNQILAALPRRELDSLIPKLRRVPLELGEILYLPDEPIEHVYFPTAGVISLLAALENGTTIEAGLIGSEGMLGTALVLGAKISPQQALVQLNGQAMRMAARDLSAEIRRAGKLRELLLRYVHVLFTQVAQTAACNRLHTVEQRLAHRLLLTLDRAGTDEFVLTQEFISRMLGVRRAGVSVAANTLRQEGLIGYKRGSVTVLDRDGLESSSCECYRTVRDEYNRFLITPTN